MGSQGVFGLRSQMANDILKVPVDKVRIITGNVGGSFGMKASAYPEYACVLHAAKLLGRPVKWTDERSGSFLSDCHGRDHETEASLALDAEGRFLAVRLRSYGNMGAYLSTVGNLMGTGNFSKNIQSNYATPLLLVETKNVVTNTTPVSAYRGAGRPEGNYFMERLIETAAREMGRDPIALRKLNHIKPEAFPFSAASGSVYDSGDFSAVLDRALEPRTGTASRHARPRVRRAGCCADAASATSLNAPPADEGTGRAGLRRRRHRHHRYRHARLRPGALVGLRPGAAFEARRSLREGAPGAGRFRPADRGRRHGRVEVADGVRRAILQAADIVIEKGRAAAGYVLEAAAEDIEFAAGRFSIAGTDRGIGIMGLAAKLRAIGPLPQDVPNSLDAQTVYDQAPMAYPNGAMSARSRSIPRPASRASTATSRSTTSA